MNTDTTLQIDSTSSDATVRLAEKLGRRLKGNEVIELISDLGGGKTTFVRGLAAGIGSTDHVASPTFTISKVYKADTIEIHHFDFYRLHDAGLMEHELHDILGDPKTVVVVEWGDVVQHVLPEDRLTIHITRTGDDSRRLDFTFPKSLGYLLEDL
jgi:tRNA threonylcarbamoyladenosine biosynthesis protein TsaE